MSYTLLFKNKHGIVMAADTRYTNKATPPKINDNGRKLAFDEHARICISIVGDNSCASHWGGIFYLQPALQNFINANFRNLLVRLRNANITFPMFIFTFLKWLIAKKYLIETDLQYLKVDLTGIILRSDGKAESIEVNIQEILPIIPSNNENYITQHLANVSKRKTYLQDETEVITGGDHLLSFISGKGQVPPPNFIDDYKKAISNTPLNNLLSLAINSIDGLIQSDYISRLVENTIGGSVDYIEMDYSGNKASATVHSDDEAFKRLQYDELSADDWH